MRRAADEIDRAVAQRAIGLVDREDQLQRDVEPFLLEKAELDAATAGKYEFEIRSGTASFISSPSGIWTALAAGRSGRRGHH